MASLFHTKQPLILASNSPRRQEMLANLGIAFQISGAEVDETPHPGEDPQAYVQRLAAAKAAAVAATHPDAWVLAADTTVVVDNDILGKPFDPAEAAAMLHRLSGRDHHVHTGVCLTRHPHRHCFTSTTTVRFRPLPAQLITAYVASGEPLDKAGGYGIQGLGGCLVAGIHGSYTNVVGLPLAETVALLQELAVITPAGASTP